MEKITSQFLNDANISKEVRYKISQINEIREVFVESYDTDHFVICRRDETTMKARVDLDSSEATLKQVFIVSSNDNSGLIYEVLDTKLNLVPINPSEPNKATILSEDGSVFEFNPRTQILAPVLVYKRVVPHNGGSKKKSKEIRKHQGIYQSGPKKGQLKPGYCYSGKKTKTGLKVIIRK